MAQMDINKDGYISREDFELMDKKLAEYSGQAESMLKSFTKVADLLKLQPGVKVPVPQAAEQASDVIFALTPEERASRNRAAHSLAFYIIDTNKNGYISVKEHTVYLQVVAPNVSEGEAILSFNTIDTDKDGKISREEFLAATYDFLTGVEETEVSKVFFGKLLD